MDEHGAVTDEGLDFAGDECEVDGSQFEIDAIQEEDDVEDEPVATDHNETGGSTVAAADTAADADDSLRDAVHEVMPLLQGSNLRPLLNTNGEMSDWVACVSSDGETYYCNLVTNETTWEPPFDLLPLALSDRHNSSRGDTIHSFSSGRGEAPLVPSSSQLESTSRGNNADMHQFVKRVLDGTLRRLDPHTQMQLEEARRRHKELEELRDEEVLLGAEHWVEMYDPTHDGFYYYGVQSGEMRCDKPESYVMQVGSDDVLRMVVRVQCAFRMKLARRKVFQLKLQRGLIQPGAGIGAGGGNSANPWVEVYDPFHKVLYYYCATTNDTRWDPPEHFISASEDREMAAAIAIQSMSRSHLARRDVKKRKATIRKKQHELAMEEAKKLRELRRKEYAAKTDDERESISRREMLEEEMEQIRDGDLFWGQDKHDQEVIRQQMEEKMLADAEAFWQRVNLTLRRRVEMEMQRSQEEDVGRVEMERISEANETDRMRAAEAEQCQLGDGFWGIQAEERREQQARLDMDAEQERSRVVGAKVHVEELHREWAEEKENRAQQSKINAVLDEKKNQKQYFKWFYHQCQTADDVLDYLWPTKQRYEPSPHKDNQRDDDGNLEVQPTEPEKRVPTKDPAFVLDDIVLRERLETEYRYSGKSIYTIHDPKDARVLGRRGRYVVSSVSTDSVYVDAAKKAERKPRPTSPTRPMPQSSKPIPNDTEADEDERIRYGMFPELHFNHLLDRNSPPMAPDPHLPARYNGVPYKSSEMSPTREILLGHHTKLTKLPSLSHSSPKKTKPHTQTKSPFGSPHGTKGSTKLDMKKKHSSFSLAMHEANNNAIDPLSSSLGFVSPFFREAQAANRTRLSHSKPISKEEQEMREAQEKAQRMRREFELRFEREELEIVRDVFVLIDIDESGTINKKELVWALQRDGEIHAVANKSALLRLLLKQPEHLEELFHHLQMSAVQRDEISWDVFRIFCEEMYISLTQQGILGVAAPAASKPIPNDPHTKTQPSAKPKKATATARHTRKGSVFTEAKEEQLIRRVFALCDQDRNGVLEIDELQQALYTSPDAELQALVHKSKALQPILHQETFIDAFRKFEPLDPRGISEEEFVVFCLEIADIAMLNGML